MQIDFFFSQCVLFYVHRVFGCIMPGHMTDAKIIENKPLFDIINLFVIQHVEISAARMDPG